jgi:5-hydroxyisourate hydrolase
VSTLSTHVLDAALGRPAAGLVVTLGAPAGDLLATAVTGSDGRVAFDLGLQPGEHRLVLESGSWFAAADRATFFPEITVAFVVAPDEHHHVAVLLSPFSYTTYRGS